jgi:hypothetical protein
MVLATETRNAESQRSTPESTPLLGYENEDTPPDIQEVLTLWRDYKQYYQGFHSQCMTVESYYFGENVVPVPSGRGFDPVRPATPRAIINTATDHIDVNNISIDVLNPSVRGRARAEKLKKFYLGVWSNIRGPVLRTAAKQAFIYGISFLKPMFASEQWPDAPLIDDYKSEEDYREALEEFMDRRSIAFPFEVVNVNPRNLIWDDSRAKRKWAIEFYERDTKDIKRRYPEWFIPKGSPSMTNWIEYWDTTWFGYIANNQWVYGPYKHGYGYLPYIPVEIANSLEWDSGKPHRRWQGLLTPVLSLLDSEARLATQYEAILRQFAWQSKDFYGPRQAAQEVAESYEHMGHNVVLPGVEVRPSPSSPPPSELLQQLNIVQTLIEEATFPNVIRGVRPRGVSSGFGISVLAGMGRLVFQGAADGLSRAIEQCNSSFAKLVENKVRGRVTVHARSEIHNFDQTIEPSDIRGLIENQVSLKAEAPEERERESLLAMRLHQAGLISLYEAQKRAGVTNPLEEQLQQASEDLLKSPLLQQAMQQLAAERMGLLSQIAEATEGGQGGGGNAGQFLPGLSQLQRPGEAGIQKQRVASQQAGQASVYPQGIGGMDNIASNLAGATGGGINVPSGQRVG